MRILSVVAALSLACAAPLAAQEQRPPDEKAVRAPEPSPAPDEELVEDEPAAPLRHLKVLEDPHEISSFYRSSQGASGPLAMPMDAGTASGPYAIAGFYRAGRASSGYSAFWTNGYGPSMRVRGRGGRGLDLPRRRVGENGDLCLLAPTFLAPVGPLMGVFWGN